MRRRGAGSLAFGKGLRHSLAFARMLHRRCVVNGESTNKVASQLSLDRLQVVGVVRLLKAIDYIPSPERLALIAQRDPGWDDDDIAEVFGKTAEWSADVRRHANFLRMAEPIPVQYEQITEEDLGPTPEEIAEHAARIRESNVGRGGQMAPGRLGGIRSYSWTGHAFIQAGAD